MSLNIIRNLDLSYIWSWPYWFCHFPYIKAALKQSIFYQALQTWLTVICCVFLCGYSMWLFQTHLLLTIFSPAILQSDQHSPFLVSLLYSFSQQCFLSDSHFLLVNELHKLVSIGYAVSKQLMSRNNMIYLPPSEVCLKFRSLCLWFWFPFLKSTLPLSYQGERPRV